jgi:DNA-directed RNA polymerase beta subunit
MERDSILGHGLASFLKESGMERSDKYTLTLNESTGLISSDVSAESNTRIEVPYSLKLLVQELQTLCIGPRIVTESSQSPEVFKFLLKNFEKT